MRAIGRFARLAVAAGASVLPAAATAADAVVPAPGRQREIVRLLEHDCGSCHGGRLTGGLGPSLTADALRERPADSLAATISYGRPGTPMPPWRRFLSDEETRWLVQRLQRGADAPR